MNKSIESRSQAYKRITDRLRNFVNHSVEAIKLVQEAKRLEIWKEKWSSWQEYCEKEFGISRPRSYQLLDVAGTVDEIESVYPVDIESGKNKELLGQMTYRQAKELKGLPPEQKAEVFHRAVAAQGGKSPKPATIATARKACSEFGDGTYRGQSMSGFYVEQEEKTPKSTPADIEAVRVAALPSASTSEVYPQLFTFEVRNQSEKDSFSVLAEKIRVNRKKQNGHSDFNLPAAIKSVCAAYKRVTNKTLLFKGPDAVQLRTLLEGGITLKEFIEVGEKAWQSTAFLARYSHQIASFVKHYGNIRHEISNDVHGFVPPPMTDEEILRAAT